MTITGADGTRAVVMHITTQELSTQRLARAQEKVGGRRKRGKGGGENPSSVKKRRRRRPGDRCVGFHRQGKLKL